MKLKAALTICSVSFHNARHLGLNYDLARKLNSNLPAERWIIAENTPVGGRDRLDSSDRRFRVIEGVAGESHPTYQHTESLHKCLQYVDTKFGLILDPDFYIVRRNWVEDILGHMTRNCLTFFGVPWHPKYMGKYRYFPCLHSLFVALDKISIEDLDLRPFESGDSGQEIDLSPARESYAGTLMKKLEAITLGMAGLSARKKIPYDTGSRLFVRYHDCQKLLSECIKPVVRLPEDIPISASIRNNVVEKFLPDSLCYMPKRKGYFTEVGLRERQLLDGAPRQWEEFMWHDEPFGFHVRRHAKKNTRNEEKEIDILKECVHALSGEK